MLKAIIFDLDGTLLNTLEDIHYALNVALKEQHIKPITLDLVKSSVGSGAYQLIDSITHQADKVIQKKIYDTYQNYYATHCNVFTKPYEGIIELIQYLLSKNLKLGVVSNKHHHLVEKLTRLYFPNIYYVHGMKEGIPIKPDPKMLEIILDEMNVDKKDALFIGDSEPDIIVAKKMNMNMIAVSYGYRNKNLLEALNPDVIIEDVMNLNQYLKEILNDD